MVCGHTGGAESERHVGTEQKSIVVDEKQGGFEEVQPTSLVVGLGKAAQLLGVCKRTLERERDRGELRCLLIGRHWKVRTGELHAYLRRREADCAKRA